MGNTFGDHSYNGLFRFETGVLRLPTCIKRIEGIAENNKQFADCKAAENSGE